VGRSGAHAETIQVTIAKLVYSPVELIAKVGDTITWNNRDIVAHTATVRGGFDVMIEANKSASLILISPPAGRQIRRPPRRIGSTMRP